MSKKTVKKVEEPEVQEAEIIEEDNAEVVDDTGKEQEEPEKKKGWFGTVCKIVLAIVGVGGVMMLLNRGNSYSDVDVGEDSEEESEESESTDEENSDEESSES